METVLLEVSKLIVPCILILQIASFSITQDNISFESILPRVLPADGHAEGVSLSASASIRPTIDGVLQSDEWASADSLDFAAQGGDARPGPVLGTIYVMNDNRNLYIALKMEDGEVEEHHVTIYFDDDHDGVRELGEDMLNTFRSEKYGTDWHLVYPLTENNFGAAPDHALNGGTSDGSAAWTSDGTFAYWEFSHPLCSSDDQDFCLSEGDTVGFQIKYVILGFSYTFPNGSTPSTWGDIIIAHSEGAEDVRIDIKPNSSSNTIDCDTKKGKVSVGIFTEGDFDAQTVDVSSVELEGITANKFKLKDLDADGDIDAVLKFKKALICEVGTSLSAQSVTLQLFGQTTNGKQFEGTDQIRIV